MQSSTPSGGESGFALIETIVSAVVLAIVALAVLSGVDGASNSAARERSRSVAASLAEQDQERMRAMSADQLTDYAAVPRDVTVEGVTYQVTSRSEWIRDDTGGTTSCTNNSAQVDYLRISSDVRSSVVGRNIEPVSMASLVAPPVSKAKGTLAVQVNDRANAGLPGKTVTATAAGGGTFTEVTNALGCAIFARIPVDTYTVSLNEIGWVDTFGNQQATKGADVLNGTVQLVTINYDKAAQATWSVKTYDPYDANAATNAIASSRAEKVSAMNGDERDLQRVFTASPATQLFPFLTPYGFFTGACAQSNPATAMVPADPDYYETNIGAVATQPLGVHTVQMYQPPIAVRVQTGTAGTYVTTPASGGAAKNTGATAFAYLRPEAGDPTPCTEKITLYATSRSDGTTGYLSRSNPGYDPGLPFGIYDVCVMRMTSSGAGRYGAWLTVNNTSIAGAAPAAVLTSLTSAPSAPAGAAAGAACP
jgi:type II secretory pathway pseudopilin PulG